ncbi:MAG TPA: ABC transporter ATP-binding protein [Ilumatobacter sp.]|nr:ABC transporter ATP-binding protein [Ilumatobacter sp.]
MSIDVAAGGPVAISLRKVSKTYPGSADAVVNELSFDIAAGEIVALVGPSGCGKTTTLKMINRLIEPTGGTIEVLGVDQNSLPAHELRRKIGYVIQQVGLFPHRTIRGNIGVVCELLGWEKRAIAERAAELVELVGLDPMLLDRYPSELSGGQQQRVGVARALAADPPILLMDEPYSAVDPIVRERLQDELLDLQHKVRKTIVFVTHDVDEAIRLGDRVAILGAGGVLAQYAAPDDLLRDPASEFVSAFLGRERGLRRLSLLSVADVELSDGPTVDIASSVGQAVATAERCGSAWVAVCDQHRLRGWISLATLKSAAPEAPLASVELLRLRSWVTPSTPLRQALDVIVTSRSRLAAVLGGNDGDTLLGFVTIDDVAGGLEA